MINQIVMKNSKFEVYGKPSDLKRFKRWRRDNPQFKFARIKEILQARPDLVTLYRVYRLTREQFSI